LRILELLLKMLRCTVKQWVFCNGKLFGMSPKDIAALLIVSALWGGSFLLMRVTVPILGPIILAESRVLIAGLILLAYAIALRVRLEFRQRLWTYVILGAFNGAIPFALISAAELHLTASIAAVLNATTPLFGALFAALWKVEILTLQMCFGLFGGFCGIGILVGWNPSQMSSASVWPVLASLIAAAGYGAISVYTKRNVHGLSPVAMATGSQLTAAVLLMPLLPLAPVHALPSTMVIIGAIVLAVFCTALARVLHFRLIVNIGPTGAALTTFLAPVFGIAWGWLFLSEVPNASVIAGLVMILGSVGLILKKPAIPGLADKQPF
jgi:drug/metabolite transporter (DMT)-like permease